METIKNSATEVRILGQRIPLKSMGDPALVREVVALVTQRLDSAEARPGGPKTPHHVVLLALLDLAEEYIQSKRRFQDYRGQIESKSREISRLIEIELK